MHSRDSHDANVRSRPAPKPPSARGAYCGEAGVLRADSLCYEKWDHRRVRRRDVRAACNPPPTVSGRKNNALLGNPPCPYRTRTKKCFSDPAPAPHQSSKQGPREKRHCLWGVHHQFGPWVVLPSFMGPRDVGSGSLVRVNGTMRPVQVEEAGTGFRYYLVRREDLREALLSAPASGFLQLPGISALSIMEYLRPAIIPVMFTFDQQFVNRTLRRSHLRDKELIARLFRGTQPLRKVSNNVRTYTSHFPGEESAFLSWLGPVLQRSIVHDYTY